MPEVYLPGAPHFSHAAVRGRSLNAPISHRNRRNSATVSRSRLLVGRAGRFGFSFRLSIMAGPPWADCILANRLPNWIGVSCFWFAGRGNNSANCVDNDITPGYHPVMVKKDKTDLTRVKTFRLSGETTAGLDHLKRLLGLSSRTAVIRYLVNRECRRTGKK